MGLQPGDVFTHRNIANIVSPTDINTAAVIEYAVAFLKVKHVVLCGHSSCGGAVATMNNQRVGGLLETWLTPLRAVRNAHREELEAIRDEKERAVRLAELNVEAGVNVLMANATIQEAIAERGLQVHGIVFDLGSGRARDLGFGTGKGSYKAIAGTNGDANVVRGKHAMLVFRNDGAAMQAN